MFKFKEIKGIIFAREGNGETSIKRKLLGHIPIIVGSSKLLSYIHSLMPEGFPIVFLGDGINESNSVIHLKKGKKEEIYGALLTLQIKLKLKPFKPIIQLGKSGIEDLKLMRGLPDLSRLRIFLKKPRENLVISFFPEYHGVYREALRAIEMLGTRVIKIREDPLQFLIKNPHIRPLFFFSINGTGIIGNTAFLDLLEIYQIPLVVWFVDHPIYLLKGKRLLPKDAFIFCWEKNYIKDLRNLGFEKVYYLPLATDPVIFKPSKREKAFEFTFVGTSLMDPIRRILKTIPKDLRKSIISAARKGAKRILEKYPIDDLWRSDDYFPHFETLSMWIGSRCKRVSILKEVSKMGNLTIFGDPDWKKLIPASKTFPPCSYYNKLPLIYSSTVINININNLQLKTAVNQRVFDCPSSGGFLLSEHSEDLDILFDGLFPSYRSLDELKELIDFYRNKPSAREKIVEKLRRIILEKHTYVNRLREIYMIMSSA